MEVYEVFITDIWNNNYLVGFYNNLEDSIEEINKHIVNEKYHITKEDLKVYVSTYGKCFDVCVGDIYCGKIPEDEDIQWDEEMDMMIRGFVFDKDNLLNNINKL